MSIKIADLRTKTDKELTTLLEDMRAKLAAATMDMRAKQLKNVKQIAAKKREIAQILTLQNERQMEADNE